MVHGLWKMGSNNRYDRFSLLDVFAIPAGMVGATNAYAAPEAAEGVAQRDVVRRPVQRGETRVIETHPPHPACRYPVRECSDRGERLRLCLWGRIFAVWPCCMNKLTAIHQREALRSYTTFI